jgi:hypothetical protein
MFRDLTPYEAGRLDSALCGALGDIRDGQADDGSWDQAACDVWDDIADVVTNDLRTEHEYMPPETNGFRLGKRTDW